MTQFSAEATGLERIQPWREMYRLEMGCQIIRDSIHQRPGWTQEYLLSVGQTPVGYGSVAVGGPWAEEPSIYEFYVVPHQRAHLFDLFRALLAASRPLGIEVQSNDTLGSVVLHTFAQNITSLKILFHDMHVTSLRPPGALFRAPTESEAVEIPSDQRRWHGVVECEGQVAATGGILFHYNRPYGDIYLEVAEPFRNRGLGSFLVQELKRLCYEGGHTPAARCSPDNLASRRTLLKAGFVPCGHLLKGLLPQRGWT